MVPGDQVVVPAYCSNDYGCETIGRDSESKIMNVRSVVATVVLLSTEVQRTSL